MKGALSMIFEDRKFDFREHTNDANTNLTQVMRLANFIKLF